jgi:pimeloyl-ACP methyl ester carboxylesterase
MGNPLTSKTIECLQGSFGRAVCTGGIGSRDQAPDGDCVAAFSEDFRQDIQKFDRPTLIIHGDDDQIVPIDLSAHVVRRMLPSAQLKIYERGPHGLTFTHQERFNADLWGS